MPGPNSQSPYEGNLSGAFSDHPRSNKWADEGGMAPTWETSTMESRSMGDSRHIDPTSSPAWNTTIIENTGTTKGSGADYKSELPNH